MIFTRHLPIVCLGAVATLLLSNACTVDTTGAEPYSEEAAATISSSISPEYFWSQAQGSQTFLGDSNQWSCFLTRMAGNYQGWGEEISADIFGSPGGGHWYLYGSSFQQGVGASARCWQHNADNGTGYFSWNQGNGGPTDMGTGWGMCALTRISGKFHSTTEFVRIQQAAGNHWFLDGGSATQDVSAVATCYKGVNSGSEHLWTSGRLNLEDTGTSGKRFCYLTEVGGNFDNANDNLGIFLDSTTNPEIWYIAASGSGAKVARSRCASFT